METNPIRYADLLKPDNSIKTAIEQLEQLNSEYGKTVELVKNEAVKLRASLVSVSGATVENQKAIQKASQSADQLTKAKIRLKQAESDNAKEITKLNKAISEANRVNKLNNDIGEEEVTLLNLKNKSYRQISAQYSFNKLVLNDMTKAERENTKAGRELVATTNGLYKAMKELQSVTGMDQLNVGNYPQMNIDAQQLEDSILNLIGANNTLGQSLRGLQGTGGAGIFQTLSSGAKAFGTVLLGLLTNPAFLVIAGLASVGAAFKFWFDYNQGLVEATRLTKQFTDLSGDSLKSYRNEVQATADMFNKDFKDVLIATNAVAKQFGISQTEALKAVQDGFVAGADVRGEFLSDLKEYPAYFKEAGISAREFVAISAQAYKAGVFSDKGVDVIKEANISIREMTKATAAAFDGIGISSAQVQKELSSGQTTIFEVIQKVSKRLGELPPQSAAVGTAIADIFKGPGEDAGLQYLLTLGNIETNLDEVKKKSGELGALQEQQLKSQTDLSNALSGLFDVTGGFFETMTTKGKIFVNETLTGLVKGVINSVNWFRNLYNESALVRGVFAGIRITINNLFSSFQRLFGLATGGFSALGTMLKGVFTLDWDLVKEGYEFGINNLQKHTIGAFKNMLAEAKDIIKDSNEKMNPLTIPVSVEDMPENMVAGAYGDAPTKPGKAPKDKTKEIEAAYKSALDARRRYEDMELAMQKESFDKQQILAELQNTRQIEDIKYRLATEKKITKEEKETLKNTILLLERQLAYEVDEINTKRHLAAVENERKAIQLRLDSVKKGSEAELALRAELLQKEMELEIKNNAILGDDERQDPAAIRAKYAAILSGMNEEYISMGLDRFDILQDLEDSEFQLLETSEEKKTRFRLKMERDRLAEILRLNKVFGGAMSKEQIQTLENTIKAIDMEITKNEKAEKRKDVYELLGLKMDDNEKKIANDSIKYGMDILNSITKKQVEAANARVNAATKETDAAKNRLQNEIEARNNGYAHQVGTAEKELALAQKNQKTAEREREKAVKRQQALDAVSQASSLITASANIWSTLTGTGPWGWVLALAALGVMWGSFAASKLKANNTTKSESYGDGTVQLLEGGSHASGNDIDLGTKPDGTRRRAEGGEFLAIVNKRQSKRMRHIIPGVINSLNDGTFLEKYSNAFSGGGGTVVVSPGGGGVSLRTVEGDLKEIRKQGEKTRYISADGETVDIYKNLTRKYK